MLLALLRKSFLIGVFFVVPSLRAAPAAASVSPDEESGWLRWVIPLPHEVRIGDKLQLKATDVRIRLREKAGVLERQAVETLVALFKEKAGVDPSKGTGAFEVLIGICDKAGNLAGHFVPGAAELAKRPNSEQAYVIRPLGTDRLVLAALDAPGLYYATRTLGQLIEARFHDGNVCLPLATITDWPDLAERGEWGGDAASDIERFGQHKLNLVEVHASLKFDQKGKAIAAISDDLLRRGRLHAVNVVPIITHLDYLRPTGIFERYPELEGVGESAKAPVYDHPHAVCFSKPKATDVIAEWMASLAEHKGVTDINVWHSEYAGQCGCDECTKALAQGRPQHVLEMLAVARGLDIVRRKYPHVGARILLTQGTYPVNDKILAAAPPEIDVTYYCGVGRPRSSYSSSRDLMIYPLLADYAARGRWLGVYPQFTASFGVVTPWSGPQFMKHRMTEFVEKKLACVCGYTVPGNRLHDFNVTAAAEWSWNVRGRNERDFALAWATRRRMKSPEDVADWAVMLGPVGWDIYGASKGAQTFLDPLRSSAQLIPQRQKPVLGQGIWRYMETPERIEQNLAACRKALSIAQRLDAPVLLAETRVIQGYMQMVKEIYLIAKLVAEGNLSNDRNRRMLREATQRLEQGGGQAVAALKEWEKALGFQIDAPRYKNTISATQKVIDDVVKSLATLRS